MITLKLRSTNRIVSHVTGHKIPEYVQRLQTDLTQFYVESNQVMNITVMRIFLWKIAPLLACQKQDVLLWIMSVSVFPFLRIFEIKLLFSHKWSKNPRFTSDVGDVSVTNIIVTNIVTDISFLYDREVQWSLNDRHLEQVKPVRS